MYFRVNLKMKKPTLCCCFTCLVFIELNSTVAFLLIRKTWDYRFAGGGIGDFKKWGLWCLIINISEKKQPLS